MLLQDGSCKLCRNLFGSLQNIRIILAAAVISHILVFMDLSDCSQMHTVSQGVCAADNIKLHQEKTASMMDIFMRCGIHIGDWGGSRPQVDLEGHRQVEYEIFLFPQEFHCSIYPRAKCSLKTETEPKESWKTEIPCNSLKWERFSWEDSGSPSKFFTLFEWYENATGWTTFTNVYAQQGQENFALNTDEFVCFGLPGGEEVLQRSAHPKVECKPQEDARMCLEIKRKRANALCAYYISYDADGPSTVSFPSTLHPVDPSDLHMLMYTNIPPTINQRLSLQMALTHCTSDIASLYQTLDDCKKMHLRLHQEIVTAEKDVGSIKAIMHPVCVLPPELLREIFMYRRKGGFNVFVISGAKCRQWRSFLMDAPITVWHLLDVCAGSLGDFYVYRQFGTHSTLNPHHLGLLICSKPLILFTISPVTFLNLEVFKVHLYNQLTTVFDLLSHMISVSSLDITCDANVGDFDGVIELPSVMSLTLCDSGTPPLIARHVTLAVLQRQSLRYLAPPVIARVWYHFVFTVLYRFCGWFRLPEQHYHKDIAASSQSAEPSS
ncbi:hypothetical protein EV421DRAFT_2023649 [Armillaria borealis]|uniref:F-box domain-containing protein n=1 Tax=Armillaria borealis TaxID=47425 RepID=A0AA39J0H3_9AGAR|nr:hypothetical protein EV421DRAFT_2023649 [Armillaria borealis]